jgi:hypothetical protein
LFYTNKTLTGQFLETKIGKWKEIDGMKKTSLGFKG